MDKRFIFVIFILCLSFSYGQKNDSIKFETQYLHTIQLFDNTIDSVESLIIEMKDISSLNEVQKAKINFVKTRIQDLYEIDPLLEGVNNFSSDSINNTLLGQAQNYIVQSRPDEGIPLIFEYLKTVEENSDSAIYAKIYLAEAYREKQEYRKGLEIIYDLLKNDDISLKNKAFAYNRIAALYDECGNWIKNRTDSVVVYSDRCIEISKKQNFTEYLAASQNELAFIYGLHGKNHLSINYGSKAYDNFIKIGKIPQAMNVSINLAYTYLKMDKPQTASKLINEAIKLSDVKENKNLFMRMYLLLSSINKNMEDYKSAYEYLKIARSMQSGFYRERINLQINEMSAKYETEKKENKIILLKKENEIQHLQLSGKNQLIISLSIGIFIFIVLSGFIFVLYRKRNIAYKQLVDKNLDLIKCENTQTVKNKNQSRSSENINKDSSLRSLAIEFDAYLKKEKPFLYSEINYDEICKKLNTNRSYLSKAINEGYNKSFSEVINHFRIKEASLYLSNPKYNHISIEGIGQMTGFNYKAAFFSNFKKQVGTTPSFFRKNSQSRRQT